MTSSKSQKVSQFTVCVMFGCFDDCNQIVIFLSVDGYPPCNKTGIVVNGMKLSIATTRTVRGFFPTDFDLQWDGEGIQLRFIQLDHRGGYCDCWSVACDVLLINSSGSIINSM